MIAKKPKNLKASHIIAVVILIIVIVGVAIVCYSMNSSEDHYNIIGSWQSKNADTASTQVYDILELRKDSTFLKTDSYGFSNTTGTYETDFKTYILLEWGESSKAEFKIKDFEHSIRDGGTYMTVEYGNETIEMFKRGR